MIFFLIFLLKNEFIYLKNESFFIRGELGEAFFDCFANFLNDIWKMVGFDMYVLDNVIWFLVGLVSTVVEIKSDIQLLFLNTICTRFLVFSICGPLSS